MDVDIWCGCTFISLVASAPAEATYPVASAPVSPSPRRRCSAATCPVASEAAVLAASISRAVENMLHWQQEMSRFQRMEEVFMAQFSRRDAYVEQTDWAGKAMSEAEYHELEQLSPDRKYEYINGLAYMMSGGSIEHDQIRRNVEAALARRLRVGPCRVFGVDVQVLLGKKKNSRPHYVYPEATVSCEAADQRRGNTLVKAPRVVVEVLSPSTEARDRGIKFKAYQHCPTIQEIVLVNQYFPYVEVWQRNAEDAENPRAWHYRHYSMDETVELVSLNLQLAMAEIYQDLIFEGEEEEE